MRIIKDDGTYRVESHVKGRYYIVDPKKQSCTCPHWMYRLARTGGRCKHIAMVLSMLAGKDTVAAKKSGSEELLADLKKNGSIDSVKAIEKYSADAVRSLIDRGDAYEKKGMIFLLP